MDDFIDFSDFDVMPSKTKDKKKCNYNDYDSTTTEFYRVVRQRKINVISQDELENFADKSFKFPYKWDPYTGEREEHDQYGPLHFHPDDLIRYFDCKKLDNLWIDPKDETGGYYTGYYGDAVGSGENINIVGRGIYPELYLFRLPITNCYLPKKYDMSLITMGPKLTLEELAEIDDLAEKYYKNNYFNEYGKKRPSLIKMKELYDQAISATPDVSKIVGKVQQSGETLKSLMERANRNAVDLLKKM
jgi:hypothetical protein